MGAVKDYLLYLQELPEYMQGWEAYENGVIRDAIPIPRIAEPFNYARRQAWYQGWDDAKMEEWIDAVVEEPDDAGD